MTVKDIDVALYARVGVLVSMEVSATGVSSKTFVHVGVNDRELLFCCPGFYSIRCVAFAFPSYQQPSPQAPRLEQRESGQAGAIKFVFSCASGTKKSHPPTTYLLSLPSSRPSFPRRCWWFSGVSSS